MIQSIKIALERSRSNLDFYKVKSAKTSASPAIKKWVEIYEERVKKLERQLQKLERESRQH